MIERVSKLRTAHEAGDPGALLEALMLTLYTQPPESRMIPSRRTSGSPSSGGYWAGHSSTSAVS